MSLKEYGLKRALREGRVLCGMGLSNPVPSFVEILGRAGLDFVFLDTEHTTMNLGELSSLVIVSELTGISTIVRVPDNDPVDIRKVLEIGAEGVIVPHVSSREDAVRAIRSAKFPPMGTRGISMMARSNTYGFPSLTASEYSSRSNDGVTVIPLIEDKEAVDNIEEITEVGGVDALMLGPGDLSFSMGTPGQFQSKDLRDSLKRVMVAAKKKDIPIMSEIGYLAGPVTVESVNKLVEEGLRLIIFGSVEAAVKQSCLDIMENLGNRIRR